MKFELNRHGEQQNKEKRTKKMKTVSLRWILCQKFCAEFPMEDEKKDEMENWKIECEK